MEKEIKKFKAGTTYYTIINGDCNCILELSIIKRTKKTVTFFEPMIKKTIRKKIYIEKNDNYEYIFPLGLYSLAPILKSTGTKKLYPKY